MGLTRLEEILIFKLEEFPLTEEGQEAIFLFLDEERQQYEMLAFLQDNPKASAQEVLEVCAAILMKKQQLS